ncbi:hypothetical protein PMAC_003420 [Pneumocystis sp. 'macacae']|nr:hypothetical protein PMAC_003420 [Pneumocystis sp. 'macacae']
MCTSTEEVYDDQEILLALILKEEIDNTDKKCKTRLKKYCKILKEIDENINKRKEDTTAQKCRGLKTNILAKSTKFKAELDKKHTQEGFLTGRTRKYLGRICSGKDIYVNLRALCHEWVQKRSNLNSFRKKLKESPSLDLDVFILKMNRPAGLTMELQLYRWGNRALTGCAYYFSECNSLSTILEILITIAQHYEKHVLMAISLKKPTLMKSI